MFRSRPVAMARHGIVTSPHYLASVAGLRALLRGGSAADAMIAVNAALGVVYPHMTGVGGDAFWLIYDAGSREVVGLNGSGRSGSLATRAFYRERGHAELPRRGPLAAITVPGAVDSWVQAHARYGRLPFGDALAPAIEYAEQGFPVSRSQAEFTERTREVLVQYPTSARTFLPRGRPPRPGELLRLPELARTLRAIAAGGRATFYEGEIAAAIVDFLQAHGGVLTREDFAEHRSQWVTTLHTAYRGYTVCELPPNTQGLIALVALHLLEGFDLRAVEHGTADYYHLLVEAHKLAAAECGRLITDPDFADIPVQHFLSPGWIAAQRRRIDPARAAAPGAAAPGGGDTVYSAVVDRDGNAVSMIQSLYFEFGSGVVAGDTGIVLQNRGSFFSLDETAANRLEPRKRTFHTLIPAMLLREGRPYMVFGTMGGEGQPQTQVALVTRVVDFGMDVQQAIDAPRWVYGRTWGDAVSALRVEGRVPDDVRAELARRGHPVQTVADWDAVMGHAQAIVIDPDTGVLHGGADPRGDGIAVGW